jgi:VIT1/CCC1 family predicted Fe2+/Mn2+ transporter
MADRSSAIDALVLILPFLVARGNFAVAASAVAGALGLFDVGAAITIFTRPPVWRSGGRQLAGRWRGPA